MLKKLLLFLLLVLLLNGCQDMYPDDYRFLQEHDAPFAYRETETALIETQTQSKEELIPTVSRASDIREKIQNMVSNGEETGIFLLKGYDGIVERDMKNMYNDMLDDSPKYIYAMDDRFSWHLVETESGKAVKITIKLRLNPKEVQDIPTLMYAPALNEIYSAMLQQSSTYTVQISGYKETDFYALLDDYILKHPNQIVEAPDISVSVFPNRGSVRVLELHFFYNTDRSILTKRREDVNSFLDLVINQLSNEQCLETSIGPEKMVEILYKQLLPGMGYRNDPDATVYSLQQKTGGNSRVMASVAAYLCESVGAECEIVVGEREGERWYWNRIKTDAGWKYFDLHASGLAQKYPVLLPASEMTAYRWDSELYPEIEPFEPVETTESTDLEHSSASSETENNAEPTETLAPAVPAESTKPTQSPVPPEMTNSSQNTEETESTEAP